ncbi:MAG: DUF234 domain-containing protein, partial [Candidatus Freyarchaeota archaeon]
VGRWWHKDVEIDVVVREPGRAAVFMEAKWSRVKVRDAERELRRLEEKTLKTGVTAPENSYVLVAREVVDAETPYEVDEHRKIIDLKAISKVLGLKP